MSSAICIFVHVHYPDVWAFIARRLEQSLRVPFRLVVTTTCGRERIAAPGSAHCQDFHIEEVANRGRDILPFLAALEAAPAFDVGLKLHTKKSPHRADGKAWGRAMVESLVGDGEKVARTVAAMRANPQIGLIAPDGLLLPLAPRLGGNLKMMRAIARDPAIAPAPDLRLSALSRARMAAGSMFWFRREAVSGLLTPRTGALFAEEDGQRDATAAHALERLFALVAQARGYTVFPADCLEQCAGLNSAEAVEAIIARAAAHSEFASRPNALAQGALRRFPALALLYASLPASMREGLKRLAVR